MNKYAAFYNSRELQVEAATLYAAKLEAVAQFKVSKKNAHMVSVVLVETADGESVTHTPDF